MMEDPDYSHFLDSQGFPTTRHGRSVRDSYFGSYGGGSRDRYGDMRYQSEPPPRRDEEIPEEMAPGIMQELFSRYGADVVLKQVIETLTDMGDLASVTMIVRSEIEAREHRHREREHRRREDILRDPWIHPMRGLDPASYLGDFIGKSDFTIRDETAFQDEKGIVYGTDDAKLYKPDPRKKKQAGEFTDFRESKHGPRKPTSPRSRR